MGGNTVDTVGKNSIFVLTSNGGDRVTAAETVGNVANGVLAKEAKPNI